MNESTENHAGSSECSSAFLPLLLLGVSFALILIFQVSILLPQRSLLNNVIKQSEQGVQQSKQVQSGLQTLVLDLIGAAKDDKDAQAIITKYGIQVSGTSPVAAPAAK